MYFFWQGPFTKLPKDMAFWLEQLPERIRSFLGQVIEWAETHTDIVAIALVGSYARGEASETSDVDLVIIASSPAKLIQDSDWVNHFGKPEQTTLEDWGKVQSIRVDYSDKLEVEYGITGMDWLAAPVDEGTLSVLKNGIQVVYDRLGYLSNKLVDILRD